MYSLACPFHVHTAINDHKHPALYNNIATFGKHRCAIKIIRMSSFDEDNTFQTLHGHSDPQTGWYADEFEPFSTDRQCQSELYKALDAKLSPLPGDASI